MNPDEGIVLQGADRILRGAVPYRDFFSFYTPGSYYWTALLFRIFGESILTARGAVLTYVGLAAVLTYMLARRLCGRAGAAVAAFAVVLSWSLRFFSLHNWDSTVAALAALYSTVWLLQSRKPFWAPAAGAFTMLTVLTEQSKGVGLLLGLAGGLYFVQRRTALGLQRRHWLLLISGLATPLLVLCAYFAISGGLAAMVRDCLWPIRHYSTANRLPYGASMFLSDAAADLRFPGGGIVSSIALLMIDVAAVLVPAMPLIVIFFAGLRLYALTSGRSSSAADLLFIFAGITIAGLLLTTAMTARADLPHILYLAPLFFFALSAVLDGGFELPQLRRCKRGVAAVVFACLMMFSIAVEWESITAHHLVHTRRGVVRMQAADEALAYIQQNVPPGGKLLVHPYHPLYSFLTATQSPTRYDYLQPGMHTREQFVEVAREVAKNRTSGVLLDLSFLKKLTANWPNTPAGAVADDPVTDYVLAHYRVCAVLNAGNGKGWTLVYLAREGTSCPPPELRR